jgi:hypothetical protein
MVYVEMHGVPLGGHFDVIYSVPIRYRIYFFFALGLLEL